MSECKNENANLYDTHCTSEFRAIAPLLSLSALTREIVWNQVESAFKYICVCTRIFISYAQRRDSAPAICGLLCTYSLSALIARVVSGNCSILYCFESRAHDEKAHLITKKREH